MILATLGKRVLLSQVYDLRLPPTACTFRDALLRKD